MVSLFRLTVFFALITSMFADRTLDALANAAEGFAVAIQQQIAAVQSITSATELADKMISYAKAKNGLLSRIESGGARIDRHRDWQETPIAGSGSVRRIVFVAGEKQEHAADEATKVLLKQLSFDPEAVVD